MNRRTFLASSAAAALIGKSEASNTKNIFRVGVIGHTGRGNYGHGLDTVWKLLPETKIVAVADANTKGLEAAMKRLGIGKGFADYRKMLSEAKPDIVAICPRHADQHCEMILAAIELGVRGIYIEKPFCRAPKEADLIITACEKNNAKLAVAHRNLYHPVLKVVDRLIANGELGKVLEIRGRGKGDRRGGGEDLWVLGSHVMNLIHYFGGQPRNCSATMLQNGSLVTRNDVREGPEGLGPLAGNEIHARYQMEKGFTAYFDSIANDGTSNHGFGLQIIGSKGTINIRNDRDPLAHLIPGNPFEPAPEGRKWLPITTSGINEPEKQQNVIDAVINQVIPCKDLVSAIQEDRQPICNANQGAMTIEMICAVFESHRQGSIAVPLPLKERRNALGLL